MKTSIAATALALTLLSGCGPQATLQTRLVPILYTPSGDPYFELPSGTHVRLGRADSPATPPGVTLPKLPTPLIPRRVLPPRVDLSGNQTSMRDQGGRDTCTVFAMTAGLEAAYKRLHHVTVDLSEQYFNKMQKAFWLGGVNLPNPEIQSETNGGGNLSWHTWVMRRYGLPPEPDLPYVKSGNFQDTNQAGDVPFGLGSVSQRTLDDFLLSDVPRTYTIPEQLTATMLPGLALRNARYRGTEFFGIASLGNLFAYKHELAMGREVIIHFAVRSPLPSPLVGTWQLPPAPTCTGPCPPLPTHAMLLLGYDDVKRTFTVKNSWGPVWTPLTEFASLSYDWIEQGMVREAITIVKVHDPQADFGVDENAQLALGRFSASMDGTPGTLDIYRLPGDEQSPQTQDLRVGTYFSSSGTAHRVNARIGGGRLRLGVDFDDPDQPGTGIRGSEFDLYLYHPSAGTMAGTYVDQRDGQTYPFVAWKGSSTPQAGSPPTATTYAGRWSLSYDGIRGTLDILSVNATTGALSAHFWAGQTSRPVTGTVDQNFRRVTFEITFASDPYVFSGFAGRANGSLIAGTVSEGSVKLGFHAQRMGPVPQTPPPGEDAHGYPPVCAKKPYLPQCRP